MLFLIEYDRDNGRLVQLREFEDSDTTGANAARLDLEMTLNRRGVSHEVVLLEAPTEADLRQTHRRYFADIAGLTAAKEFRASMHQRHADAFALHRAVAELLESAIAHPRPLDSVVRIALDMLMTQAYKSHYSVRLIAEIAHTEDAALLTRRLMELAVQAAYIGADSDPGICSERAGKYLADLWRNAPTQLKHHVPPAALERWRDIWTVYGSGLPKRGWGPSLKDMFSAIGQLTTYDEDYRFLSAIAHGSTEEAVLHYSMPTVNLRSDVHLPSLLIYASRYYLGLADIWNRYFNIIDPAKYRSIVEDSLHGPSDIQVLEAPAR